jgi:fibronectin-binding autotransporter adhesin
MNSETIIHRRRTVLFGMIALFVLAGLILAMRIVQAATRTWDGGSAIDGNWQTAANWQSNLAPVAGDDLVFGTSPRTSSTNNFAAGTIFNSITLGLGGNFISGNSVGLNAGLTMTGGILSLSSIKLINAQTFSSTAGGGGVINSPIDLNGNSLTLAGAGSLQFIGAITGSGGLIKNDSGRIDLFGGSANTFTGQTKINDGLLQIAKPIGVSAVSSDLVIGDGLGAANSAVTRQFQNSQIPQQVTINSDGLYDLNGFYEALITLAINGGNVTVGTGQLEPFGGVTMTGGSISSTGAGKLLLSTNLTANPSTPPPSINGNIDLNGGTRTFTVNRDPVTTNGLLVIPAIISNGSLTKTGAGDLRLQGNNTYSGATNISAGQLSIEGNQSQSAVQMTGGELTGLGTAGPVTVTAGRLRDYGNCSAPSFTRLTVQGNLSLGASAFYRATVCNGFENSRIMITGNGTVNLGGSNLEINNFLGPTLDPGRTFTIIDNDGTDVVQGTFNGLPEGASLVVGNSTLVVSYHGGDGNDVTLHVSAVRTWDGGSAVNNNWTTKENWAGDLAPVAGDNLVFPADVSLRLANTNDFPNGTTFSSLTLSGGGYQISGNQVNFNAGITADAGSGLNILNLIMGGPGGLTKTGAGGLWLQRNNIYTGTTLISAGTVTIDGTQPQSPVQVTGGEVRSNVGTTGAVTVTGGRVADASSCALPFPNTFTVQGNLSLNSSAFYKATICGSANPGYQNARVRITGNGSANLGGSALEINSGSATNFEAGRTFIVIDNDGTDVVQGTFNGLPEGAPVAVGNATLFISYRGGDGNDVTLHVPGSRTWDGGSPSNSNWTTKENWVGDVAPDRGDALVFQNFARTTNTNDFPAGMSFNSITFLSTGFTLNGNSLALTNGITGAGTISLPIKLNASQTFTSNFGAAYGLLLNGNIDTNGKQLTLDGDTIQIDGVLSGSGGLKKLGQNSHYLSANNSYTGPTTIMGGQLTVGGNQPGSAVQISNGSLAGVGTGTVKSITATGGAVIPLLTDAGNHHLDVIENTVLDPASSYQASLGTTTGGLIAAHLDVGGTVNLAGSALVTQLVSYGSPTAQLGDTVVIIHAGGTTPIQGTFNGLAESSVFSHGSTNFRISYHGGDGNDVTLTVVPAGGASVQFSSAEYSVNEGQPSVNAVVTRVGDTSGAATVNYTTSDGSGSNGCNVTNGAASSRCDYETSIGTLHFAGGETSKGVSILLVDDSYAEGSETFALTLSDPVGATLGSPSVANVTIVDNEAVNGTNPVGVANFFVRQHYLDFLNREPDASGLTFWSDQITSCGTDQACIDLKRINVSAAFFLSIEFQETGYLVERIYKTAYGSGTGTSTFGPTHQLQVPIIRFQEFLPDTQQIGRGVVVGQSGWELALENNKVAFTTEFVQRPRFTAAFPVLSTPAQFVDMLFLNAGVNPSALERAQAINEFAGAGTSADTAARARALRRVAENSTLKQQESNRAFVLMQYFGYLRRNPDDAPDSDYTGYDFWLTKLNEFNGNFVNAEMVKAFIVSGEYRQRFGP